MVDLRSMALDEETRAFIGDTISAAIHASMANVNKTIVTSINQASGHVMIKLEEIKRKVEEVVDQQQFMVDMVQNLSRRDSGNGLISSLSFHETSTVESSKIVGIDFEEIVYSKHKNCVSNFSILDRSMWNNVAEVVMEESKVKIQENTKSGKDAHQVFDGMSVADFDIQTTDETCVVTKKNDDDNVVRSYTQMDIETHVKSDLDHLKDSKKSQSDDVYLGATNVQLKNLTSVNIRIEKDEEDEFIEYELADHQYYSAFVHPIHQSKPLKNFWIKMGLMKTMLGFLRTRIFSRGMDCNIPNEITSGSWKLVR